MKAEPRLFDGIAWSTPEVMAETRLRAQRAGLKVVEPAMLWDVDTPEDYDRAVACGLIDARS
jgi:glycosyltransferase A (GT-A) superfamily protein (DUF2064 family)